MENTKTEKQEQQIEQIPGQQAQHNEAKVLAWAKFRDPHGATWSVTLREGVTGEAAAAILKKAECLSEYLFSRGWKVG